MPILKRTETEMPIVSTDKHFSVNVNLKPLFGAEEGKKRKNKIKHSV